MKLTLKQYLASKDHLRAAVKDTPKITTEYNVVRYCKLIIGEDKEVKQYVPLKPKQTISIEWLYENIDNPTPISIKFDGVKNIDSGEEFQTFWTGAKLLKWLDRNTKKSNKVLK